MSLLGAGQEISPTAPVCILQRLIQGLWPHWVPGLGHVGDFGHQPHPRALSAWLRSAPSCVGRDAGQERPLSVRQVQAANYLLKPDVLAQSCHEEFQGAPALGGPALKSLPFHRGGEKRLGLPGEKRCPKPNAAAPGQGLRGVPAIYQQSDFQRKTLSPHS